jgi:hypothetical protein
VHKHDLMSVKPRNVYSLFNFSSIFEDYPYHWYLGSRTRKKEINKERGRKVRMVAHILSNVEKENVLIFPSCLSSFSVTIRRHGGTAFDDTIFVHMVILKICCVR